MISRIPSTSNPFTWAVVGAGPAGLAVVGKLLDGGADPLSILWIDPAFQVGDLGTKWRVVSGNTKVGLFIKFLYACRSFEYKTCPKSFLINHLPADGTCLLKEIADPLQWISNHLCQKVAVCQGTVRVLTRQDAGWQLTTDAGVFMAKKVILATGADPRVPEGARTPLMPLEVAMDFERLKEACSASDRIAVFGSSHSAIVALYNLAALGIETVNVYRSPLKYASYYEDWILYDNTGLKGYSATWAKEHMEDAPLKTLMRVHQDDPACEKILSACTKYVYATGFEKRVIFETSAPLPLTYNDQTGEIAPHLYGLGIAFPEGKTDKLGNFEYSVGLWKFMAYLERILPLWFAA
ncbi:MAG: FAD-dependent oxidoreductase [Alphaproteobacteria bacterium]|nr:FAD-dependent oxidoreductase [Alphaproteobacteria bacterium]